MIKKLLVLLIVMLPLLCKAQIAVGDWKIHSVYNSSPQNIIDTPEKVYYVNAGNLYSYDKDNEENESYSKRSKLSDILIHNIYYNYDKK